MFLCKSPEQNITSFTGSLDDSENACSDSDAPSPLHPRVYSNLQVLSFRSDDAVLTGADYVSDIIKHPHDAKQGHLHISRHHRKTQCAC